MVKGQFAYESGVRVIEAQELAAVRLNDPYANPERQDFDMIDMISKTGLYVKKAKTN